MNNIIEIRNLNKSYKGHHVLKDLNLVVKPGEIFALLGSNGAGKTTCINIMSTLLKHDSGDVLINNFDIKKEPKKVREAISLTGQFAAVDELLSAKENMILIAKLFKIKDYKKRVDYLLDKLNLTDVQDKKAGTFSGGMRRRLDIGMGLASNPKIIFLDEPTTGLDPQNRIAIYNLIKELKEQGMTIFLTTQYLDEAEILADYIAVLHEGKIIKSGVLNDFSTLVKKNTLELTFASLEDLNKAVLLLNNFKNSKEAESLVLKIQISDGVKDLTEILNKLKGLNITNVLKEKISLEEAFLILVGEKNEEN